MAAPSRQPHFPVTPDGHYFVVEGRLWRATNPNLSEDERQTYVRSLMRARRDIATARRTANAEDEARARKRVHKAKVALGERGPVWWDAAEKDYNRHMAKNSPYADWFKQLAAGTKG